MPLPHRRVLENTHDVVTSYNFLDIDASLAPRSNDRIHQFLPTSLEGPLARHVSIPIQLYPVNACVP